jgi:hypothetical protein
MWKEVFKRSVGRPRKYETAEQLAETAAEYFQWVSDTPFLEEKAFAYQGEVTKSKVEVARPYTLTAFCLYAGISDESFRKYCDIDELAQVCQAIRSVVDNQKFEGAAANLFNANIISRDLGLTDKQSMEHSGHAEITVNVSKEDLKSVLDLI